jgi:uncharacterized membrane protein
MYSRGQVVCTHDSIYWGVLSIILTKIITIIVLLLTS